MGITRGNIQLYGKKDIDQWINPHYVKYGLF